MTRVQSSIRSIDEQAFEVSFHWDKPSQRGAHHRLLELVVGYAATEHGLSIAPDLGFLDGDVIEDVYDSIPRDCILPHDIQPLHLRHLDIQPFVLPYPDGTGDFWICCVRLFRLRLQEQTVRELLNLVNVSDRGSTIRRTDLTPEQSGTLADLEKAYQAALLQISHDWKERLQEASLCFKTNVKKLRLWARLTSAVRSDVDTTIDEGRDLWGQDRFAEIEQGILQQREYVAKQRESNQKSQELTSHAELQLSPVLRPFSEFVFSGIQGDVSVIGEDRNLVNEIQAMHVRMRPEIDAALPRAAFEDVIRDVNPHTNTVELQLWLRAAVGYHRLNRCYQSLQPEIEGIIDRETFDNFLRDWMPHKMGHFVELDDQYSSLLSEIMNVATLLDDARVDHFNLPPVLASENWLAADVALENAFRNLSKHTDFSSAIASMAMHRSFSRGQELWQAYRETVVAFFRSCHNPAGDEEYLRRSLDRFVGLFLNNPVQEGNMLELDALRDTPGVSIRVRSLRLEDAATRRIAAINANDLYSENEKSTLIESETDQLVEKIEQLREGQS